MKGFQGAGVLEIVDSFAGNAYRAMYKLIKRRLKDAAALQRKEPSK